MNVRYYVPKNGKVRLQMCSATGWADVPEVRERDEPADGIVELTLDGTSMLRHQEIMDEMTAAMVFK